MHRREPIISIGRDWSVRLFYSEQLSDGGTDFFSGAPWCNCLPAAGRLYSAITPAICGTGCDRKKAMETAALDVRGGDYAILLRHGLQIRASGGNNCY